MAILFQQNSEYMIGWRFASNKISKVVEVMFVPECYPWYVVFTGELEFDLEETLMISKLMNSQIRCQVWNESQLEP